MSQPPHQPSPIIPGNEAQIATVQRLRQLSHLLDNAVGIPGTRYRIGLDPLLGLLPGGGDIAGAVLSGYIVYSAAKLGLPREALVQMVSNILFETFAGTVPVLGDLVDVTWKANTKNVALLESHLNVPQPNSKKADKWFVFMLLAGLMLVVIAVAGLSVFLISLVVRLFTGG
ncbi:DUF4112 domain-containing protein [Microcoleus sp. FACHB-68]|uniref:DUF4112 domain-containing protein n=1 Tax=Microcoleus sp. FACHB-68 TaxID=2692826 RepID=UPI0016881E78|nr:DUF4112 domain-containing protein [Microcoleus sp. FACHB-68]MBD1939602.1 DUF4112 domain-containing protein [Microcoleus sp. FACHB-68]